MVVCEQLRILLKASSLQRPVIMGFSDRGKRDKEGTCPCEASLGDLGLTVPQQRIQA